MMKPLTTLEIDEIMMTLEEPEPAPVTPKQDQLNASLNTVNSQKVCVATCAPFRLTEKQMNQLIQILSTLQC